ncbi:MULTISPECIES: hypothetical protein [Paenibacillus]|uniref:hypothetical protein n=1 Tax=Paenibacillus TaxID=44249 RepID=UPI0013159DDE|nr:MULTISPECIES: hypothetical protein [Paenibacillus]
MSTSIIITATGYTHGGSIPSHEKEWVDVSVARIRQRFHAEYLVCYLIHFWLVPV